MSIPPFGSPPASDKNIKTSDITDNNFSTAKHGFVPKGTNVGNFLKDDGTWAAATADVIPSGTSFPGGSTGDMFYRTDLDTIYIYDVAWRKVYSVKEQETLWKHHIQLPFTGIESWTRSTSGIGGTSKVLAPGSGGAWDDTTVRDPNVLIVDGVWYMFYAGNDATSATYQIGVATSTDGITWTKSGNNPIITKGAHATSTAWMPNVVYDESASGSGTDLKWKMWYADINDAGTKYVNYAYSNSPDSGWTTTTTNITAAGGVTDFLWAPATYKVGDLYYMIYGDTAGASSMATSSNMVTWTKKINAIIPIGAGGTWDDVWVRYGTIYWDSGVWYYLYTGFDGSVTRVGMAISYDGSINNVNTYTKFAYNPILGVGSGGAWDDKYVASPSMVRYNNSFYMYYIGSTTAAAASYSIGLATLANGEAL